ncbi:MAG: acyltransferase family protein [Cyclobacteriaceae bacterium]|nr:acyltransferase family protein [Cyclobacteriaceae bacterium]
MLAERRYDIDWLRVIAIGLLLIYHIAIGFQPWGVFIGFIQNNDSLEHIWVGMAMLNVWRIPLLFFVSGMGVWFAIQRRDWKQLLIERSRRILLPFLFGMIAIVPLHIFLWQRYYNQSIHYIFNPAHLWFLGNIFSYVLLLSPLFFYLKKNQNGRFRQVLNQLLNSPLGLIALIIPFILEAELVRPQNFELYAMTLHGYILGLLAFMSGFLCVYSGKVFWENIRKWRWVLIILSTMLYILRIIYFDFKPPYYLLAIESNLWIYTVFGFGYRYLNKPSKILTYLSQAAYPVYIIHMLFLYLGASYLFTTEMAATNKFLILNVFTLISCLLVYEFIIRRVNIVRPLLGLRIVNNK